MERLRRAAARRARSGAAKLWWWFGWGWGDADYMNFCRDVKHCSCHCKDCKGGSGCMGDIRGLLQLLAQLAVTIPE